MAQFDLDESRPLVSVIIPFLRYEKGMQRAILSVDNQTYENVELILINDSGTDLDSSIVQPLNLRIPVRLERNKFSKGQAGASNFGVEISRGTYIKFLDSDDSLNSAHIEHCVKAIQKFSLEDNSLAVAVVSHSIFVNGDLTEYHEAPIVEGGNPRLIFKEMMTGHEMLAAWKWLIPRDAFVVHQLRWDEDLTRNKDFVFSSRLLWLCDRVVSAESAVYYYTKSPNSEGKKFDRNALNSLIISHRRGVRDWCGQGLEWEFDLRLRKLQQYIYIHDIELAESLETEIVHPNRFELFGTSRNRQIAKLLTWRGVINLGKVKRWLLNSIGCHR